MGFRLIEFDLEIAFQERGFWAHPMEFIESRLYAARQFTRLMNVNIDGKNINAALKNRNLQITWPPSFVHRTADRNWENESQPAQILN